MNGSAGRCQGNISNGSLVHQGKEHMCVCLLSPLLHCLFPPYSSFQLLFIPFQQISLFFPILVLIFSPFKLSLVYCQVVLFCFFLRGEVILFCVGNALLASTYMLAFQRLEYLFSMSLSYVNARYCLNIRSFFLALVNIILFSLKHKKGLFIFSGKKFLSNVFL